MAATPEGNALSKEERDRMCRHKKRFDKEGKAIDFIVKRQQRGELLRARVFRCPVCAGHHITTTSLAAAA